MSFTLASAPDARALVVNRSVELPLIENDELVLFLHQAAESELDGLVACLIERGGPACQLKRLSIYKRNSPRHRVYVNEIAAEIQKFGGNTIANALRSGKGIRYQEIVQDVARRLGVGREGATEQIEARILQKQGDKIWEGASIEERTALLKQFGVKDYSLVTRPALPAALITAVHVSGFGAYQFSVIVANAVTHALLGHGLSFVANAALTKGVSVFAGPPGWCLVGFLATHSVTSEAYRVTIPAVAQVAMIRNAIKARREREEARVKSRLHINPKIAVLSLLGMLGAVIGAWLLFVSEALTSTISYIWNRTLSFQCECRLIRSPGSNYLPETQPPRLKITLIVV
jgi:uncharacterized protein YaaW (UPF0174 family)